jgi:hypothetical protein
MSFAAARVALHRNARSRGYKLFERGSRSQVSFMGVCVCVCVVSFDLSCSVEVNSIHLIPLGVAPASPFIVSKERARVTFAVKR